MSNNEVEEFLQHHGVKGMKWGVRRAKSKSSVSPSKGRKKLSAMEKAGATKTKAGRKAYGDVEDSIDYSRPKRSKKSASATKKLRSIAGKTLKAAKASLDTAVAIQADVQIAKSQYKLISNAPNMYKGYVAEALLKND